MAYTPSAAAPGRTRSGGLVKRAIVLLAALLSPLSPANAQALRPPAVPLVTHDPYFSVWSTADTLTEDQTRHWTGTSPEPLLGGACRRQSLSGHGARSAGAADPGARAEDADRLAHANRLHIQRRRHWRHADVPDAGVSRRPGCALSTDNIPHLGGDVFGRPAARRPAVLRRVRRPRSQYARTAGDVEPIPSRPAHCASCRLGIAAGPREVRRQPADRLGISLCSFTE